MELSLDFQHVYDSSPVTPVAAVNPATGARVEFNAFVDTGADDTLLDQDIARALGITLDDAPTILISGVGGQIERAPVANVWLELLRRPQCGIHTEVTFARNVTSTHGNLLGINVWEMFDLGLIHSERRVGLSSAKSTS
jgi:hypothetical protein